MSSTLLLLGSFPRAHNMSIGGVDMVVTPISASQQSIGFSVKYRSLHGSTVRMNLRFLIIGESDTTGWTTSVHSSCLGPT